MLKIKLLETDVIDLTATGKYEKYKLALNKVLNKEIEVVNSKDENYDGYYIVPIEGYSPHHFSDLVVTPKSFLLGMDESVLDYFLEMNPIVGYSSFRNFMAVKSNIVARAEVLQQQNVDKTTYTILPNGFAWYNSIPVDFTFETMVNNHLNYLKLYDAYLKSK